MTRVDRQGADFSEILPAELQCTAPDNALFRGRIDKKIPEMIVQFAERSGQQFAFFPVNLEQAVNSPDVPDGCFSDHKPFQSSQFEEE